MSQPATVHVLPTCDILRIFELRDALRSTGGKLVLQKPKAIPARIPFDPNDGGRAA